MRGIERQVDRAGPGPICAKVREGRRLNCADALRPDTRWNTRCEVLEIRPADLGG
jgi:hypothetical protein